MSSTSGQATLERTGWHELTWSRPKSKSRIPSGHIRHFSTAGLSERTWRRTLTAVDAATEHDYGGRGAPPGARLHRRLAMSHLPRARRPFTFHHPKRDRRWRRHDRSWERREMNRSRSQKSLSPALSAGTGVLIPPQPGLRLADPGVLVRSPLRLARLLAQPWSADANRPDPDRWVAVPLGHVQFVLSDLGDALVIRILPLGVRRLRKEPQRRAKSNAQHERSHDSLLLGPGWVRTEYGAISGPPGPVAQSLGCAAARARRLTAAPASVRSVRRPFLPTDGARLCEWVLPCEEGSPPVRGPRSSGGSARDQVIVRRLAPEMAPGRGLRWWLSTSTLLLARLKAQ